MIITSETPWCLVPITGISLPLGLRIMEAKMAKCDCILEVHDARVCARCYYTVI